MEFARVLSGMAAGFFGLRGCGICRWNECEWLEPNRRFGF